MLTLHYLNNGINVELYLQSQKYAGKADSLKSELLDKAKDIPWLNRLTA